MNLSKIMAATLEQFNEEVMKEFDRRIDHENYEKTGYKDLRGPNDSLLDPDRYPESPFEIDADSVKDFITQKLITQKELILRMVREKVPTHSPTRDYESTLRNRVREEFLNNLDTI